MPDLPRANAMVVFVAIVVATPSWLLPPEARPMYVTLALLGLTLALIHVVRSRPS